MKDIPTHTGHFTEEEESKDTSTHAESTGNATTAPFISVLASCPRPPETQYLLNTGGGEKGSLFDKVAGIKTVDVAGDVVPVGLSVVSPICPLPLVFLNIPIVHPLAMTEIDPSQFESGAMPYTHPPLIDLIQSGLSHLGLKGEETAAARRAVGKKTCKPMGKQ